MAQFSIIPSQIKVPIPVYSGLENIRKILSRNVKRFESFYSMGNRVLDNQHPLVKFLLELSVDVKWTPEYLFNLVEVKHKQIASQLGFNSVYKRGRNYTEWFYPELNHNVMVTVPFDDSPLYSATNYPDENTHPSGLYPLMTTSTIHYWNIDHVIDTIPRSLPNQAYTVIQLDVYQFVFGYYWYLQKRIKDGIKGGLTPHHYCSLVLMDLYIKHNEMVNLNCLVENRVPQVQDCGFAMEPYIQPLEKYLNWGRRFLMTERIKSFSEYMEVIKPVFDVDRTELMFPRVPKSMLLSQMAWVYTLQAMYYVTGYFHFMDFTGSPDGAIESRLKTFFKIPMNFNTNQIVALEWSYFYSVIWKDLKER